MTKGVRHIDARLIILLTMFYFINYRIPVILSVLIKNDNHITLFDKKLPVLYVFS